MFTCAHQEFFLSLVRHLRFSPAISVFIYSFTSLSLLCHADCRAQCTVHSETSICAYSHRCVTTHTHRIHNNAAFISFHRNENIIAWKLEILKKILISNFNVEWVIQIFFQLNEKIIMALGYFKMLRNDERKIDRHKELATFNFSHSKRN